MQSLLIYIWYLFACICYDANFPEHIHQDTANIGNLLQFTLFSSHLHVNTFVSTSCVVTLTVWSPAGIRSCLRCALVHILAWSSVRGQLVARRTGATISSRFIVTFPHTLVDILTFVHVYTCPAILRQLVSLTTMTPVRSPQVDTLMAANVWDLHTFIDVHTWLACMFEPWFADTSVGPWVVLTLWVNTTDKPVDSSISDTLVHILTNTIDLFIPRPTNALVWSQCIDTGGPVEAGGLTAAALVHVLATVSSTVVP